MAHHCHRACVGRRRTALVALFAGLLLVVAPTAGASAPTVTRLIAQQATIEADFNTNGLKFNLNAGHVREFVDGVLTRDEVGAVGSLFTWECEVTPNGTSCGGGPSPWGADCHPIRHVSRT